MRTLKKTGVKIPHLASVRVIVGAVILSVCMPLNALEMDVLDIAASGVMVQKQRLKIIAENIANANTQKTDSGLPYKQKIPVITSTKKGALFLGVVEDQRPFQKIFDPENPLADEQGFIYLSNVQLQEAMIDLGYTNVLYEANTVSYKIGKTMLMQSLDLIK